MANRVTTTTTKKKAAAGGAAKAKRAAGGNKKPAGGAAAKAAGKTKPATAKATSARKKPATAPAAAPRAALGGGDAAALRVTKLPAAALAPDVTRHDVNWGAEGARRHELLVMSADGSTLTHTGRLITWKWAQGAVGVTRGKHWFSVTVTRCTGGYVKVGWVDRALTFDANDEWAPAELGPGWSTNSRASGAVFMPAGYFYFGTAPLSRNLYTQVPAVKCPCTVGCLLDADAGAMTVFVNGKPLKQQCAYKFPNDGREWAPSVGLNSESEITSVVQPVRVS
jgi:hypothetical protein